MKFPIVFNFYVILVLALSLLVSGCDVIMKRSSKDKKDKAKTEVIIPDGGYQFFQTRLENATWTATSSPLNCTLTHNIHEYGRAIFSRKPKQGMYFSIEVNQAPKKEASAILVSSPPPWKHWNRARELGAIPIVAEQTPFYLNNGWARRLIDELREGMMLVLLYRDWSDGSDEVSVAISAQGFHSAWHQFEACQFGLATTTFEDIEHSVFLFDFNQSELDVSARQRLDQIVEYFSHDSNIRLFKVDGYTDSKGFSRINIKVANRRANMVKDYLVSNGIPAAKIQATGHHEKKAKYSNRTEEGRDKNRRVEVILLK